MTEGPQATPADGSASPAVAAVLEARGRLDALDEVPVAAHAAVYDEVHGLLQTTLAGLDER